MESNTVSIITCIISGIGAFIAGVSAYLSYRFNRDNGKAELERELNRILEIGINYPRYEFPPFVNDWPNHRGKDDEEYLRYDIYCNMIFNFLHHVFEYYRGDKEKIEGYVDVKTWIRTHKQNWLQPADDSENIDGYDDGFRRFINSYII